MRLLLLIVVLAGLAVPALAQTECYSIKGKMVCCTKVGNYTSCN